MSLTFKVAGADYSDYIQSGSYECLHDPDVNTWTDANYKRHFEAEGNIITGVVSLGFASENNDDYKLFVDTLKNATIDMVTPLEVYVMDENVTKEITARVEISSVKIKDAGNGYYSTIVKLKFEEP